MHTLEQLRCGALAGSTRLDLCADLTELPDEVLHLADSLEVLNLSGNRLNTLPAWLPRLPRLKVVFASGNPFTELPEVLGDCPALDMVGFKACRIRRVPAAALPPRLRWLILTDNAIEQLPDALGERPRLQKLMLAGNRLQTLPEGLAGAQRLELLRLSANRFEALPAWLTALPRLSWLALAGNPMDRVPPANTLPQIHWDRVHTGAVLGEGASGRTVAARVDGMGEPLALKLFKGAVTSDGLPEHEMAAGQSVGTHPGLCTPVAVLQGHPQGGVGAFLPMIPHGHRVLAGPPSLTSCTRDVYPTGWRIGAAQALRLLGDTAEAVAHLHHRHVMHGDLYAHNIFFDPATGQALLTDLGAAALLPIDPPAQRRALQALEVRAFGCLVEELGHRLDVLPGDPLHAMMAEWAAACMATDPRARPSMAEVSRQFAKEVSCWC
jgi:hypothetical protein